jgi:septal ring factor EnvC (AmiA/AmiB activator)
MGRNKHKRKNNHVVIVTSDAADVGARQFRIRPWILQVIIIVLCVIIGALIGYFIYEKDIWTEEYQQVALRNDELNALQQEKEELEGQIGDLQGQITGLNGEITDLNGKIDALNGSIAQKDQEVANLRAEIEKQFLPTNFPLTTRAAMETVGGEEPVCVFTVASGSMVVATAKGTVRVVNEDPEYGYNIWVDHENGYITIYRCRGDVKVKQGETVTQGATLLLITEEESRLGYQMTKDGVYVDPMDMLEISG